GPVHREAQYRHPIELLHRPLSRPARHDGRDREPQPGELPPQHARGPAEAAVLAPREDLDADEADLHRRRRGNPGARDMRPGGTVALSGEGHEIQGRAVWAAARRPRAEPARADENVPWSTSRAGGVPLVVCRLYSS